MKKLLKCLGIKAIVQLVTQNKGFDNCKKPDLKRFAETALLHSFETFSAMLFPRFFEKAQFYF